MAYFIKVTESVTHTQCGGTRGKPRDPTRERQLGVASARPRALAPPALISATSRPRPLPGGCLRLARAVVRSCRAHCPRRSCSVAGPCCCVFRVPQRPLPSLPSWTCASGSFSAARARRRVSATVGPARRRGSGARRGRPRGAHSRSRSSHRPRAWPRPRCSARCASAGAGAAPPRRRRRSSRRRRPRRPRRRGTPPLCLTRTPPGPRRSCGGGGGSSPGLHRLYHAG